MAPAAPAAGRSTGLPVPRFVSLDADRVHLRYGPGREYPVSWVLARKGLPVEIIAEFDTWRKVKLHDGDEGWIHSSLLSSRRTVMIKNDIAELRRTPDDDARVVLRAEPGVIGELPGLRRGLVSGRHPGPARLVAAPRVLGRAARRESCPRTSQITADGSRRGETWRPVPSPRHPGDRRTWPDGTDGAEKQDDRTERKRTSDADADLDLAGLVRSRRQAARRALTLRPGAGGRSPRRARSRSPAAASAGARSRCPRRGCR